MLALLALVLVVGTSIAWASAAWRLSMPRNRLPFITGWTGGVVLALIALSSGQGSRGAALVALVLGLILLFFAATSRQRGRADMIRVGQTIPAFHALDDNGERIDSSSLAGSRLLIKFFRGHW